MFKARNILCQKLCQIGSEFSDLYSGMHALMYETIRFLDTLWCMYYYCLGFVYKYMNVNPGEYDTEDVYNVRDSI